MERSSFFSWTYTLHSIISQHLKFCSRCTRIKKAVSPWKINQCLKIWRWICWMNYLGHVTRVSLSKTDTSVWCRAKCTSEIVRTSSSFSHSSLGGSCDSCSVLCGTSRNTKLALARALLLNFKEHYLMQCERHSSIMLVFSQKFFART